MSKQELKAAAIILLQRIVDAYDDANIKRHARGLLLAILKI